MQRTMDRILRKVLDFINKYETVRWKISSIIANKILNLLTFLEKQSKKGIILRRVQLRLKEKYQPGVPIPGKNFREIEGVESAFIGAFHYRLYPYSKVILVLLAIVAIDNFSNTDIGIYSRARLRASVQYGVKSWQCR